jgi:N-acetylglucosamine-6-phosphate deacetylase
MRIINAKVYGTDYRFHDGSAAMENGVFTEVLTGEMADAGEKVAFGEMADAGEKVAFGEKAGTGEEVIDAQGKYLIPGLIDMHFHGCMGMDVCDATEEAVQTLMLYEASVGVTAICPATMTLPAEELERVLENAAACAEKAVSGGADLVGINMEGPFISPVKKGAQDSQYIKKASVQIADRFLKASGGLVRFIGLAPEESSNAAEYIRAMKDKVHISLAHTNAGYDEAKAAFDAGACHAVHLYNAMPAFSHRAPGVIGAAADSPHVTCEIICDGIHVHPSAVRGAFKLMGEERMILISDSIRATGMKDGVYTLGGQDVQVRGKEARLVTDGALAGSVTNLADCMRTVVREMGIPLETAIRCATANPARALGIGDRYGSIEAGKKADAVLLNEDLSLCTVFKNGVPVGRKDC